MLIVKKCLTLCLLFIALLNIYSCSSDNQSNESANIRYINANFVESSTKVNSNGNSKDFIDINFGEVRDYQQEETGLFAFSTTREDSPVIENLNTISVGQGQYITVVISHSNNQDEVSLLRDDLEKPDSDQIFNIRLGNFYDESSGLDVYLVNADADISNLERTRGLSFRQTSLYLAASNQDGPQRIIVTQQNSKTPILDSGSLSLEGGRNYSYFIIPKLGGGGEPKGILTIDGDS